MRYFAIVLLAVVYGCARTPIVDGATPGGISIRYDPVLVSGGQAAERAQTHCQKYGTNAELTSRNDFRTWMIMNFRCIK